MRLRPLLLGFVVVLLDCATLEPLQSNACGNGVVDKNEDCDTFPNDPKDKTNARCGAPTDGEAACHLQCGLQASGETFKCPDGWGCNVKGICRAPTGRFSPALGAVSGGVEQLSVGDFDGDGRRDLLGSGPPKDTASRLRVHYFDDAGGLVQVAGLPAQAVAPVVFDHDHNGRDDIAFGIFGGSTSAGGLGVVSGLADRTFLPVVFPAVTVPAEAEPVFVFQQPGVKLPNGNESDYAILLLQSDPGAGVALTSIEAEIGGVSRFKAKIQVGIDAVQKPLVSARVFDGSATSACGEVVMAVRASATAGVVHVVSPCIKGPGGRNSKWDVPGTIQSITTPALRQNGRGVLVADFDDDGHLDVLVDVDGGPYIAYGDASGTSLGAAEKWQPSGLGAMTSVPMPLAVGDLNGDGKLDVVLTTGVAVKVVAAVDGGVVGGRDGIYLKPSSRGGDQAWTEAAIGNFNGDGFPDLVTATVNSPDVQVFAGGPSGATITTVTTDGVVQAIAKGDFDGDHIDDIAIAQATSASKTSDLSIAYGRPFGAFEPARRIGSVDTTRGLRTIPHGSSPTDLGSYSYSAKKGPTGLPSTSFTLLIGSGDRQPLAPLLFVEQLSCARSFDPCEKMPPLSPRPQVALRNWFPVGLAAGAFAKHDESAVLSYAVGLQINVAGAVVGGPALGAWTADANPDAPGGLLAPKENRVLDGAFDAYDIGKKATKIATATADIDNLPDGLSSIVVITNVPGSSDALLLVVRPSVQAAPKSQVLPGLKVAASVAQLALVDLDGDGFRDAVGFFGEGSTGQVVAFLNDQKGNFVVPGITLKQGEGNPVAFASLSLRGAPPTGGKAQPRSLAVLTDHSLVLVTLKPDKRDFDVTPFPLLLGSKTTGGKGIAAGDFNGDGLDDIAIADGSIRIILQNPDRSAK